MAYPTTSSLSEQQREYREEYLTSAHWHTVRLGALERAEHRCQVCNGTKRLDVHHRTYERIGAERPVDLTVLCRLCHDLYHSSSHSRSSKSSKPKKHRAPPDTSLTPLCERIVDALEALNQVTTTDELARRTGIPRRALAGALDALRLKRVIKRSGPKRKREWVLASSPTTKKQPVDLGPRNERLHEIQQRNKQRQREVREGKISPTLRAEWADRYRL